MTKTKRSNASSKRIAPKGSFSAGIPGLARFIIDTLSAYCGVGMIICIACLRTAPRVHERTDPLHAFSHRRYKTLLGFIMVCGQEKREQVQAVHLFVKGPEKVSHS